MKKILFKPYLIVLLAALFYTYEYLLRIEPSVMMEYLMNKYTINTLAFGTMVGMYYNAYTPMQMVVGVMIDRYGPRRMLISALVICLVGIFLFYQFDNYYIACLARFLLGVGSSFAFVGAVKLAAMWLPSNRFALFAGTCTALGMLGGMVGDVTLSWGIEKTSVQSMLHLSFWSGVVLLLLFFFFLENKKKYSTDGVDSSFKAVFKGLYSIMIRPEFWFVGLMGATLYLSVSGWAEIWGINYMKIRFHLPQNSPLAASINSLIFFGWLIGSPLMGWLSDKIRVRVRMLLVGSFIAALLGFMLLWLPIDNVLVVQILSFLFGLVSSSQILVFAYARDQVGADLMATAASFMNLIVMCGGLVAQPLVGELLRLTTPTGAQVDGALFSVHQYQLALSFVPIMMLIGGIVCLVWYIKHKKQAG